MVVLLGFKIGEMHHAVSSDVQKCLEPERWRVGCSLRTLELAVASEPSRRRSRRRRRRRRRKKKKCFATPAVAATTFMRGAV